MLFGLPEVFQNTTLVNLNRCPTKDRMLSWGLSTDPACILCNSASESRDHLFFNCNYSFSVWNSLTRKTRTPAFRHWSQSIDYMQTLSSPKHQRLLSLLTWQAAIYTIQMERNSRIHRKEYRSVDSLISSISAQIKKKISSIRQSSPVLASSMMQYWLDDKATRSSIILRHNVSFICRGFTKVLKSWDLSSFVMGLETLSIMP